MRFIFYFIVISFSIFLYRKIRKAYRRYTGIDFNFSFTEDDKKEMQKELDQFRNAKVISLEEFKKKMKWN